jgi:hypothetical protein
MIYLHKEPHGRAATLETQKFYEQATLQRLQQQEEVVHAIANLRALNAERRLQDQRDMDEHYRNYIVPV